MPPLFRLLLPGLLALAALPAATQAQQQKSVRIPMADGFDYPVGAPDGKGYYLFRGFWPNGHLGDDWNGVGGGDSDLGDPITAIGPGVVTLAGNQHKGWGNTVIIRHAFRDRATGSIQMIDSFYTHMLDIRVKEGQMITKGQRIGSLGSNSGMYPAHLHLEIRKNLNMGMDRTLYARDYSCYYSPKQFIDTHRKLPKERGTVPVPVDTYRKP